MQVGGADLHQAGHRHFLDFAEAAEVDFRNRRDAGTADSAGGRGGLGLAHHRLDVGLHVFLEHAAFRAARRYVAQLDAELAGQHAHGRTGVHLAALAARRAGRSSRFGRFGGCRGRCRRSSGRSRGGGRRGSGHGSCRRHGAGHAQGEDQLAGADLVVELDRHAVDGAGLRAGDLHAGLVGLQHQQRLVGFDHVTGLDQQFDDAGLAGRADVRHVHRLQALADRSGGRRRGSGLGRRGGHRRFGYRRAGGRSRSAGAFGFQLEQVVAGLQLVAQLDLQALDHPGPGGGDLHAGLVGFQGQQALVGVDTVADLDQQFDHFTFAAADIGYANQFTHRLAPQQSSGLALLVSMPNLAIASATRVRSISPRSARASSAVSTTQ
ncbi:hypothetical protein D3C78_683190 [compost metagenome]